MLDRRRLPLLSIVFLAALASVAPASAIAAPRDDFNNRPGAEIAAPSELVRHIQDVLTRLGFFSGEIDGRMSENLRDAVEAYQRAMGRNPDGKVSEELAEHMETQDRVGNMLQKLESARDEKIAAARKALMEREETRKLLKKEGEREAANPTRDASGCFADPDERCLLTEAVESAKAIFKPELRDWAYGEILVSQAKAGLIDEAISTVRRIGDARLIIVALRDISRALAQQDRIKESREVAELIPDLAKRLEALSAVVEIMVVKDRKRDAQQTAEAIIKEARGLDDMLKRVTVDAQMAAAIARAGNDARALTVLGDLQAIIRNPKSFTGTGERGVAMRHVAQVYAEMGEPARALALLGDVSGDDDRTAVLLSVSKAQAKAGQADDALATASRIESARYKAAALGRVAVEMARHGEEEKAFALVGYALRLTRGIDLPYARSYAAGQIALSLVEIGARYGEKAFSRAIETSQSMENDQLRAYVLWSVANGQSRMAMTADAAATTELANRATRQMVSSFDQVWMLADVAAERIAAGEGDLARVAIDRGLIVAKGISDASGRARALARLAAALYDAR
jgi:peptidoglycan hydrolase-like protein with peptidoglycan-binding domain